MSPAEGSTPDPVGALAAQVDQLQGMVVALAGDVVTLSERLKAVAEQRAASDVHSWLATDDAEAARLRFADLLVWLCDVWVHFPGHPLPACWYLHPWIVEELWVAMGAWRAAQRRGGSWAVMADWHRTVRPGVADRIEAAAGTCDPAAHRDPTDPDRPVPRPLPVPDDADAIADHWADHHSAPPPQHP